jgi:hypothetical protein
VPPPLRHGLVEEEEEEEEEEELTLANDTKEGVVRVY